MQGVNRPLVIRHARIVASPDANPVEGGTIVIRNGLIERVEPGTLDLGPAEEISGEGLTAVPGFWNCHVHFTEPKWRAAVREAAPRLEHHLREMLTRWGFTTVVDAGSDPRVTVRIRHRVEAGEVAGPRIYTAGTGLYPPHGLPYYLAGSIPFWWRPFIPQPSTPSKAEKAVDRNLAQGAELVKLFTGSYVARGQVKAMPLAVATAAVARAHDHRVPVFSHPSNLEGTEVAVQAGVDVLAHPPDITEGVGKGLLRRMVGQGMGLIPTLKMFETTVSRREEYLEPIRTVVHEFQGLGGEMLFGTDVGYMTDYSTEEEFRALARAGVNGRGMLRMLTQGPAARFHVSASAGSLAPGRRGDLVLLEGDPLEDAEAFARVRTTVRNGRVLYPGRSAEA